MKRDPVCGMKVRENAGFKLAYEGREYYFCSEKCMQKFASENDIPQEELTKCEKPSKTSILKNKTAIVSSILILIIILSYIIPFLEPLRESLFMYAKKIWWAVLLGLLAGGIIDNYVPREYISSILAVPKKRTVFYSVILGFFMSFCSHGILALSIQLYKKGASASSVVSFLLASPWANIVVTIMLFGFFGLKALFILISAILIAIITGFIFQLLESKELIEKNESSVKIDQSFSIWEDIKKRFKKYRFTSEAVKSDIKGVWVGTVFLSNMVLWWILIGIGLASVAGTYVHTEFFKNYMGASLLGLLITLVFATVIEVCSEGSAPIAFELFKQTGALGNSFVFLMAGVATDYTEIGLIWNNIGKKTAIWLPIVTVPQVLILGFLANLIF